MIIRINNPIRLLLVSPMCIVVAFATLGLWTRIAWDWDPNYVVPKAACLLLIIAGVSLVCAVASLIGAIGWLTFIRYMKTFGRKQELEKRVRPTD